MLVKAWLYTAFFLSQSLDRCSGYNSAGSFKIWLFSELGGAVVVMQIQSKLIQSKLI